MSTKNQFQRQHQVETVMAVPPDDLFAFRNNRANPAELIANERQTGYILDPERPIEYPAEGGIYAYHIGAPFPEKGFPDDNATYALDGLKRMTIGTLRALMTKDNILPAIGLILMPKKAKVRSLERFIEAYTAGAYWWVGPFMWKPQYLSNFGRALYKLIINVLTAYGVSEGAAERFAHVLAYLMDYDNSYRLRTQDLFSETTKEKLMADLRGEVKRLLLIFQSRQVGADMQDKFRSVAAAISYLTYMPSFKKAMLFGLEQSDFSMFQYDDSDSYHILLRDDYNHKGYTAEERKVQYVAIHRGKFPPRMVQR